MNRIGILGDIGSGKTYVAQKFGYPVFNADLEVSKLYKKDKKTFYKLRKNLPKYFNLFPIKKEEVLQAIMDDKKNLKKIIKIVHFEIRKKMEIFLKKNEKKKFIILDIPLLLENNINKKGDILIFVQSNKKKILKKLKKRKKSIAADIGCGSGEYTYKLSLFFRKVEGYDISKKMINIAKKKYNSENINYFTKSIEQMSKKKKYDYVLAVGLLDYLRDFNFTLFKLKILLKKNGEIIFTCPKSPSLFSFIRNNPLRSILFQAPEIVESVNKEELIKYCKNNRLKILNVDSLWTTMWIVHAKVI